MTDKEDKPADAGTWWITTESGRRVGYMWPEDMYAILQSIWGERQGINGFCAWTGMARGTVERFCNGKTAIPKDVAMMVKCAELLAVTNLKPGQRGQGNKYLPKNDADWLPDWEHRELVDMPPFKEYG